MYAASEDWGQAAGTRSDDLATRITRAGTEPAALVIGSSGGTGPRAAIRPFDEQLAALAAA